jgi:hypothetical protein
MSDLLPTGIVNTPSFILMLDEFNSNPSLYKVYVMLLPLGLSFRVCISLSAISIWWVVSVLNSGLTVK